MERVLAGTADRNEIRMIRKDGEIRWIRYLAQPEWDAGLGRVTRVRALAQDITARQQAMQVEHVAPCVPSKQLCRLLCRITLSQWQ